MKIDKRYKLHRACSRENSRYAINGVYLDKSGDDGPVMVATEGHFIAVVPVDDADDDVSRVIPADAVKEATTGAGAFGLIASNGTIRAQRKLNGPAVEFPADDNATFPDWRAYIPNTDDGEWITLGINAKLLHLLAEAMGSTDCVILKVPLNPKRSEPGQPDVNRAMHAMPGLGQGIGAYGAIMPIAAF